MYMQKTYLIYNFISVVYWVCKLTVTSIFNANSRTSSVLCLLAGLSVHQVEAFAEDCFFDTSGLRVRNIDSNSLDTKLSVG